MGNGFPGQCSPTTTWPQEVVSGELGFRESFAAQAPLRATLLSLASQAPGAEVWFLTAVGYLAEQPVLGDSMLRI